MFFFNLHCGRPRSDGAEEGEKRHHQLRAVGEGQYFRPSWPLALFDNIHAAGLLNYIDEAEPQRRVPQVRLPSLFAASPTCRW
jgi:hypothetical protein